MMSCGLRVSWRSSVYDLYYFPHGNLVAAIDARDQSYVGIAAIPPPGSPAAAEQEAPAFASPTPAAAPILPLPSREEWPRPSDSDLRSWFMTFEATWTTIDPATLCLYDPFASAFIPPNVTSEDLVTWTRSYPSAPATLVPVLWLVREMRALHVLPAFIELRVFELRGVAAQRDVKGMWRGVISERNGYVKELVDLAWYGSELFAEWVERLSRGVGADSSCPPRPRTDARLYEVLRSQR